MLLLLLDSETSKFCRISADPLKNILFWFIHDTLWVISPSCSAYVVFYLPVKALCNFGFK